FEYQVRPTLLWYGYYGGAYFQRNVTGPGGAFGFGTPGTPSSPGSTDANRAIQQGTIGLTPTFWKKPEYGALQLITQYSYLVRTPWWVPTGTPKNAHAHLVYLNLRYVL